MSLSTQEKPLRRDAAENRQRLLDAAGRVFAEHGPDAGVDGGRVVAVGTPEAVAKHRISRTAPFLRDTLRRNKLTRTNHIH